MLVGRRRRSTPAPPGRLLGPAAARSPDDPPLTHPPSTMAAPDLTLGKLFDVRGKTVLITGGGGGLGLMMSAAFVQNGAKGPSVPSRPTPSSAFLPSCDTLARSLPPRKRAAHPLTRSDGSLTFCDTTERPPARARGLPLSLHRLAQASPAGGLGRAAERARQALGRVGRLPRRRP